MYFRKKPIVIQAIQLTVENIARLQGTFGVVALNFPLEAYIDTPEGQLHASPGDWIIRGVQGELYPCKPDIFAATYDQVKPVVAIHDSLVFSEPESAEIFQREQPFDFGEAVRRMKDGAKVASLDWNGTGMYAILMPGYPDGIAINKTTSDATGITEGTVCRFRPYYLLKTTSGDFAHWSPSGSDTLSERWVEVDSAQDPES